MKPGDSHVLSFFSPGIVKGSVKNECKRISRND